MLLRAFGMPKWSFKLQENPIKAKEELKMFFDTRFEKKK